MKKDVNMLEGSITKGLLSMSIPIMIMNVAQNLFSLIDMTILGNLVNDKAVGAVGACSTLISLITGLLIGLATGANVIIARHIGRKESGDTKKAVGTAILTGLFGGVLLLILGVAFARVFLEWTNCSDELIVDATKYFKIYFMGVPFIMLYNFCASVLRSKGDTKRPMIFLIIGGVAKIGISVFCVKVFNTTVEGVALGTVSANIIAGGLCFYTILKSRGDIEIKFREIRFYFDEFKRIIFIGIPAGLETMLFSIANVIIMTAVNSFGPEATTGISIANQYDGILYQISTATSFAVLPYISQNVGAGKIKRVKKTMISGTLLTVLFGASFGVLSAIFSKELTKIMSNDPLVIMYSQQKMIIISSTYFICGINHVMCSAMRGVGKPVVSTVTTLIYMCLIRFVWVYVLFPMYPNFTFLYSVWPIGWILSIVTLMIFYLPAVRKLEKQFAFGIQKGSNISVNA